MSYTRKRYQKKLIKSALRLIQLSSHKPKVHVCQLVPIFTPFCADTNNGQVIAGAAKNLEWFHQQHLPAFMHIK